MESFTPPSQAEHLHHYDTRHAGHYAGAAVVKATMTDDVISVVSTDSQESAGYYGSEVVPLRTDFARVSINEGFDWPAIMAEYGSTLADDTDPYLVVFRSLRAADADVALLTAYDDAAHAAARTSPALRYYFAGESDAEGYCLSFCLWTDRNAALQALRDPAHRAAASLAASMYQSFTLSRYYLSQDAAGNVRFEDPDVREYTPAS